MRDLLRGAGPVRSVPELTPAPTDRPRGPVRAATAPAASELGAVLVRQTAAPGIFAGRITTVAILFRNTGTAAWVKGTPAKARLGLIGEDMRPYDLGMAVDWPHPTRPALQDELVVEPGGTAQFAFQVKGTTPGRHLLRLAPVVDGVAWMDDAVATVEVTVR